MMSGDSESTLDRFFAGVSEYVFHTQLGVVDPQMVDYVSKLLLRFTRSDGVRLVRFANGQLATEVAVMMNEAEKRIGEAKREVHRQIGDYTLFWSGLFPEALRKNASDSSGDPFVTYCSQGKRAYHIAATIVTDEQSTSGELLQKLSEQFELCAYGLREIRREWERRDGEAPQGPTLLF